MKVFRQTDVSGNFTKPTLNQMIKIYQMKKLLLLLAILLFIISCNGNKTPKAKSLSEETLELENFDFDTKISTLVPEKNKKVTKYGEHYELKSEMMIVDTITNGDSGQPIRIRYNPLSYTLEDAMAKFDEFDFNAISLETTLGGKIMAVNGLVEKISLSETQVFIDLLNKKYGKAIQTKGDFVRPFDIFTWQLKDRIIKYCIVINNETNTMKIVVDNENKEIKKGKKEQYFGAYIYLIKNEYAEKLIGKMGGKFSYCD
jgi:hypothetical protein